MKLSILIPVFNEEKTIAAVIQAVENAPISVRTREIIVVDDASKDTTQQEIQKMTKRYKNIKIITHTKNLGKGAAVRSALAKATGEYILIQDADLEYNPKDIQKLIDALGPGEKVVYGTRLKRMPHFTKEERTPQFLLHYMGNKMLSLLTSVLYGQWITDMETGYKLFPKEAIHGMALHAKGFEFEPEITAKFLKKGYKITEVAITTIPRGYSEGKKLNTMRDGFRALWTLVQYRVKA